MKFHPFKIVHKIKEDDPDRRMQVCDRMESMIRENQHFFKNVILSDKCAFHKNGTVHRLNGRTVGLRESKTKYPEQVYTCGQDFLVIILNIFWSCTSYRLLSTGWRHSIRPASETVFR